MFIVSTLLSALSKQTLLNFWFLICLPTPQMETNFSLIYERNSQLTNWPTGRARVRESERESISSTLVFSTLCALISAWPRNFFHFVRVSNLSEFCSEFISTKKARVCIINQLGPSTYIERPTDQETSQRPSHSNRSIFNASREPNKLILSTRLSSDLLCPALLCSALWLFIFVGSWWHKRVKDSRLVMLRCHRVP